MSFFFFQAEDGIRDHCVTGVQTCALPICRFRNPQSAIRISFLPMSVQAIAWSPSGAVRIIDQRALPEARIERDLRSEERRVGKECRTGWARDRCKKKNRTDSVAVTSRKQG